MGGGPVVLEASPSRFWGTSFPLRAIVLQLTAAPGYASNGRASVALLPRSMVVAAAERTNNRICMFPSLKDRRGGEFLFSLFRQGPALSKDLRWV